MRRSKRPPLRPCRRLAAAASGLMAPSPVFDTVPDLTCLREKQALFVLHPGAVQTNLACECAANRALPVDFCGPVRVAPSSVRLPAQLFRESRATGRQPALRRVAACLSAFVANNGVWTLCGFVLILLASCVPLISCLLKMPPQLPRAKTGTLFHWRGAPARLWPAN